MKPALFERIQIDPLERYESIDELYDSIAHEIECIIDKQSISLSNIRVDLPNMNPYDSYKLNYLASNIEKEIREYESRLLNPSVGLGKFDKQNCVIMLYIYGNVEFNNNFFEFKFNSRKRIM